METPEIVDCRLYIEHCDHVTPVIYELCFNSCYMNNCVVMCTLVHTRVGSPRLCGTLYWWVTKRHILNYCVHVREAVTLHVVLPVHIFVRASF
jgi:hypothetical protein